MEAEVIGVIVSGSRCRGIEKAGSDLDVVLEYKGNVREDAFFDILHEDGMEIGGVKVDINPITEGKTGTLAEYLLGVEKHLEEKRQKTSVREKLKEKKSDIYAQSERTDKSSKKKTENVR